MVSGEMLSEFKCPAQKKVEHAACNAKQICIALTGGEVVYFEADQSGNVSELARHDVGLDVACLDCESIFLVLGCWDNSIKVLSLERSNLMASLSSQMLPSRPWSIALTRDEKKMQTRLDVGLQSGILVRSLLDLGNSGAIVDTRSHVLGSKPVKVQRVFLTMDDLKTRETVSLCCSTRAWLSRADQSPAPISYRTIEYACPFKSASLGGKEGMVSTCEIVNNEL
jgi:splicing factor 3B subunit 3